MKISATVLTHNNHETIERCLKSLSWCDEILIIDDGSTDDTCTIARRLGARVFRHDLKDNFAAQHNFAVDSAQNSWILSIDSDEVVSPELQQSISRITEQETIHSYRIKRQDHFWGTVLRHGEVAQARNQGIIRLVRKSKAHWIGDVHETIQVPGMSIVLKGYLDHYPHQQLSEFIQEVNRYSSIRAEELLKKKIKPSLFTLLMYPCIKFIYTFILRAGFLDGPAGFAYAFLMSFHSFLVRAKLYQYWMISRHDR